ARSGMISPQGRSRTFDAAADGYVRGEACRSLLIARADALGAVEGAAAGKKAPASRAEDKAVRGEGDKSSASARSSRALPRKASRSSSGSKPSTPVSRRSSTQQSGARASSSSAGSPSTSPAFLPPLAVVLSTAINTNGRASSLTAPHGPSQQALYRLALRCAALEPQDVAGLQLHSNGTALGDPIEA
ncbi:hypothetical protein H632_c5411p0, partial [Helicosporidium sp. ATCC 50920]